MRRPVMWLSAAALVVAPMIFGVAAPAGARATNARFAMAVHAAPAAVPNTNIKGKGATLAYKPAKLSAVWTGPPPAGTCTAANEGLTVTNTTAKAVTLTQGGATFGKLPAHQTGGICGWGTKKGSFVFGLQGSTHTLTVKFH